MEKRDVLIEKIWREEQEILDVIHKVCMEHHLRYSLAFGTLIGAIRHGGFIPWDDDIDIMMPREDYNKLLEIWGTAAPQDYILQDYNTDLDYTNNFAKIRKNHTTFIQFEYEKEKKYHKGIFVDIFPGDRVAPGKFSRKIQYVACAVNLLYSRGFTSGSSGLREMVERILLKTNLQVYARRRNFAEKIISHWSAGKETEIFFPCVISWCNGYYHPADMFEHMIFVEFMGKKYCAVLDYDKILKLEYGDYMKLPPEAERVWKHHPILVDFEYNYEELVDKER